MSVKHEWSELELNYLRDNAGRLSYEEIGWALGVSDTTVRCKAIALGLKHKKYRGNRSRVWTEEELAYLREHFPVESATDIADHFGVSYTTVRVKALELGLEKAPEYSKNQFQNRYVNSYKHRGEGFKYNNYGVAQ